MLYEVITVAMDAADRVQIGHIPPEQLVHHVGMALDAVVLEDPAVLALDENRLMEILQRESLGVVVAVLRLGHVLGEKGVGQMAIHAGGRGMVAGLLP